MRNKVTWSLMLLFGLCALIIFGCSNDSETDDDQKIVVESGHEGHDHGPGENHDEPTPAAKGQSMDWCREHSVPQSECTACNPSMIAEFKESGDWCAGHGLPESHCRLCNPEIVFPQEELMKAAEQESSEGRTAAVDDWCMEHSVPESECTACNPSLIAEFKETGDWCAGHGLPESHCRLCNPEIVFPQEELMLMANLESTADEINIALNFRKNASVCATDGSLIQFASSTTAKRAGITVQSVRNAQRERIDEAPAEIVFDETGISAVTLSVDAFVKEWLVSPGDKVKQGQPLARMQSPEIARLGSDLIASFTRFQIEKKELERHSKLKERNLISDADWDMQSAVTEQARAHYYSARNLLTSVGFHESDLTQLIENNNLSNQFKLRAPADGVVIERTAGVGELRDAGSTFAVVGDPSAMWIEARLTERQMHEVDLGHHLTFSSDGGGINRVGGEIIWVSRFLDPHTRTGTVRARINDPGHNLRAGEFGRVQIIDRDYGDVALVPKDAVQWEGCCNVVFVKETDERYRPRKVNLVGSYGPFYQVENGVYPGQEIVVDGAFLLKTELKKSSIGAGCCGFEPAG